MFWTLKPLEMNFMTNSELLWLHRVHLSQKSQISKIKYVLPLENCAMQVFKNKPQMISIIILDF